MFPEYVEKYEQQQLAENPIPEQVSLVPRQKEKSRPLLEKDGIEGLNKVEAPRDIKHHRRQSFPTWIVVLLVSVFGIVMALPLLQL